MNTGLPKAKLTKTSYKLAIGKILTPKVLSDMKIAQEKRFEAVTKSLEDENEPFLERVKEWIQEYLDECYSISD